MKLKVNGVEVEGSPQDVVAFASLVGAKAPESAPEEAKPSRGDLMKAAWRKRKLKKAREAKALAKAGVTVGKSNGRVTAEEDPKPIKLKPKVSHKKKKPQPRAIPDSHIPGESFVGEE
jgi:hypothetical protein